MQVANTILSQWGPALLVCFTVIIGLFYQNTRMTDLRASFDKRFDDLKSSMDKRFDDMRSSFEKRFDDMGKRFDDLKDLMKSEFKLVDERIDRLESPLVRK
jgi:hypothetical protein